MSATTRMHSVYYFERIFCASIYGKNIVHVIVTNQENLWDLNLETKMSNTIDLSHACQTEVKMILLLWMLEDSIIKW